MLKLLLPPLLLGASALSAQIYSENFDSYAPGATEVTGWTRFGGYGTAIVDTASPTSSGSNVAYFDTQGSSYLASTTHTVDTGLTYVANTSYTLTFDLFKTGAGVVGSYVGDFTYSLYAFSGTPVGTPDLSTDSHTATTSLAAGTLLGSGIASGSTEGAISLSSTATASGSGNVWIFLYAASPSSPTGYMQVELDNISVSASAIPEPSSFAALAGLGVLGAAALRRRRRIVA